MSKGGFEMLSKIMHALQQDAAKWKQCESLFEKIELPSKTTLLCEGDTAARMYIVKKGCLRLWFNHDGKDITFQFFFENQAVSSFESFFGDQPSIFSLESIESTIAVAVTRENWERLFSIYPHLKDEFHKLLLQRMGIYARLFLSRIKDTPQERYEALQREHPEILRRIPQHYIASYLGITPVSLSRIRRRLTVIS